MAACAHGADYESCPSKKVAKEFNKADKKTGILKKAMKEGLSFKGHVDFMEKVRSIAKKHDVSVDSIHAQVKQGIGVEHEHTQDDKIAEKIALDHLEELPDYYTRLSRMEKK